VGLPYVGLYLHTATELLPHHLGFLFSNFVSVLHVQVVEETQVILREYGFRFVRRGPIFVKGKGELLTFFLKGRDRPAAFPNGSSVTLPHQVVDNP
jgi:hypothetical protein